MCPEARRTSTAQVPGTEDAKEKEHRCLPAHATGDQVGAPAKFQSPVHGGDMGSNTPAQCLSHPSHPVGLGSVHGPRDIILRSPLGSLVIAAELQP